MQADATGSLPVRSDAVTPIRSAALVVNARSRSGQDNFRIARELMAKLPFPVEARAVTEPKTLVKTTRELLAAKPDLFVIGGGDGTVSCLVDELVGAKAMLGVLPFGTANSFARTLGIPLDVEGAVEVLRTGTPRRIDLGMIDGDYFANCAAIGLSPLIADSIPHAVKRYLGRVGYLSWATLQFARFKPFTLVIEAEDGEKKIDALEVRIANGPYHGGTLLVDEAALDSGRIVIQVVEGRSRARLLRNWGAGILGSKLRHADTVVFEGEAIRFRTDPPLPISIDGEVLAQSPATARVAHGVIEVMAPARPAQGAGSAAVSAS
jgi:YegS/Rv2252/BmrU family lipid kinase